MLLNRKTLKGIAEGSITLAFRRWKRPTVKAGGTLLTAVGQLRIEALDVVEPGDITAGEAVAAGFSDADALRTLLDKRPDGEVYRIRLSRAGPDPRSALRETLPDPEEMEAILERLARTDARTASGPWTRAVLELLAENPGVRAADLAPRVRMDTADFKPRVRKLKGLGLTISLGTGYRLSPRGEAVLQGLREG